MILTHNNALMNTDWNIYVCVYVCVLKTFTPTDCAVMFLTPGWGSPRGVVKTMPRTKQAIKWTHVLARYVQSRNKSTTLGPQKGQGVIEVKIYSPCKELKRFFLFEICFWRCPHGAPASSACTLFILGRTIRTWIWNSVQLGWCFLCELSGFKTSGGASLVPKCLNIKNACLKGFVLSRELDSTN